MRQGTESLGIQNPTIRLGESGRRSGSGGDSGLSGGCGACALGGYLSRKSKSLEENISREGGN